MPWRELDSSSESEGSIWNVRAIPDALDSS